MAELQCQNRRRLDAGHERHALPAAALQVLLDETVMASGRLDAGGVGALRALKHLMTAKAVDYDFQYYVLPQPADTPVTVAPQHRPVTLTITGAVPCSCCLSS